MKLGFLPSAPTPSVLESEVLGLCHYGAHLIPVFWHGACGQEWTAAMLQLPQLDFYVVPGAGWHGEPASGKGHSLQWGQVAGYRQNAPDGVFSCHQFSKGHFYSLALPGFPVLWAVSLVKGQRSWHCSALWRKGQSTAFSMAGNDIGLLCQTQCYVQFTRPLRDHQGPQL